ncbi:hypothetical protein N0B44_17720 [Roseibacterium beibuensis]|uniref:hypothetical protein n=1 Tax=[Roseibacterium] beibuensis TaxID=1193142 RepID=UPI00217E348A|nr:hypothetical protein [Roseibacterium beibuensis]MCS6624758.1 hypothetical protein [Roseibacterium beibuensis]
MRPAAALAACALVAACATAGGPVLAPTPDGYLGDDQIARIATTLPIPMSDDRTAPSPVEPGTDRWWLATAHAELRPPEAAQHFDCALGTRLAARPRPALQRLMARLLADADALTREAARARGHVARPIAADPALQPCQRVTPDVRDSPSWPAGGAVVGTLYGEAFAALAPDRAEQARRIGREIGVSRVVCRMNGPQDVWSGALGGRALFDRIGGSEPFQADLAAARIEVAAARAEGLSNPSCAAERRALGPTPGVG